MMELIRLMLGIASGGLGMAVGMPLLMVGVMMTVGADCRDDRACGIGFAVGAIVWLSVLLPLSFRMLNP